MSKYENIRDTLQTGDIVLFSGHGMFSKVIKLFSHSKWSHVGMVVKSDELDLVLLWESTGLSKVMDINDDVCKKGVQTVSLSERIGAYDGDISVRKLNGTLTDVQKKSLNDFRKTVKNKPYEKDMLELAGSLIDFKMFSENEEDLSSCFCSELVAEGLQQMGILNDKLPSNEFIPKDFAKDGRAEHYLNSSITYGNEIVIK